MQVLELFLFKDLKFLKLSLGKQALKCFADLTLDSDGNVLLDEVLNHGKVIGVVLGVIPEIINILLDPPDLFLEAYLALLLVLAVIYLALLSLQPLLEILE